MKKLKLNLQTLSHNAEVLTRSQLKKVLGGLYLSTSSDCGSGTHGSCKDAVPCPCPHDFCDSTEHCITR
jgi:hypothetical protein